LIKRFQEGRNFLYPSPIGDPILEKGKNCLEISGVDNKGRPLNPWGYPPETKNPKYENEFRLCKWYSIFTVAIKNIEYHSEVEAEEPRPARATPGKRKPPSPHGPGAGIGL